MVLSEIKALVFDVFGTVVDYRGTIMREGQQLNQTKGLSVWRSSCSDYKATRS